MRVIGGRLGGRALATPRGSATRPTSDRVREALFSILGAVDGATVLDLYAGTGALGIEALSRGASRATFVENGKAALAALRENLVKLGLVESATVLATRVEQVGRKLASGTARFDLVFADPPYEAVRDGRAGRALEQLVEAGLLAPSARIVVEHGGADAPPELSGLALDETRRYGDTAISFYVVG